MTAGVPVYSCGRMARSEYQVMHVGQTMSRTTTTIKSIACNSRGQHGRTGTAKKRRFSHVKRCRKVFLSSVLKMPFIYQ